MHQTVEEQVYFHCCSEVLPGVSVYSCFIVTDEASQHKNRYWLFDKYSARPSFSSVIPQNVFVDSECLTVLYSHPISIFLLFTIVAASLKQPSEVDTEALAVMIHRVL